MMKNCEPLLLRTVSGDGRGHSRTYTKDVRVGAGVGHGKQAGLFVLQLEVLVGKLVAIDGLATSALCRV